MSLNGDDVSTLLRARYPAAFEQLVAILRKAGLNAYDVIAEVGGPIGQEEMILRICYGRNYEQFMEWPCSEPQLLTPSNEIIAFFEQAADGCRKVNIADYRAFMRQAHP